MEGALLEGSLTSIGMFGAKTTVIYLQGANEPTCCLAASPPLPNPHFPIAELHRIYRVISRSQTLYQFA